MASPELIELWKKIDADLRRARCTLPPEAADDRAVREYLESFRSSLEPPEGGWPDGW